MALLVLHQLLFIVRWLKLQRMPPQLLTGIQFLVDVEIPVSLLKDLKNYSSHTCTTNDALQHVGLGFRNNSGAK